MSKQPNFFDPLPSETITGKIGNNPYSSESQARTKAFEDYYSATSRLDSKISDFRIYSADGLIGGWVEAHQRRVDTLDAARAAFYEQLRLFTGDTSPLRPSRHSDPVTSPTPDKLERWPGETPDEHEHRLFTDFGIRIPEGTDFPVDTAFFLPKPPDMTLELLTHIRDLLAELVAKQAAAPAVNFNVASVLDKDTAKLWESLKGISPEALRHITDQASPRPVRSGLPSEIVLTGDPDIGVALSARGGHNRVAVRFKDRTALISAALAFTLADQIKRTAHALEEGWVAPVPSATETEEEALATAGTETPGDVDTSPLVVHKTAALQDAISARDAVFFRLRNLATQPITEYSHEQLARMGEEMGIKQAQVHRCTEQLEKARAAEVARGGPDDGPGKFSNRRRPGTRFPNPTPPAAPETPDPAQ